MEVQQLPVEALVEAPWNANRVPPSVLAKIRNSILQFGLVENLVARPHPEQPGRYELLSGNHRSRILLELGRETAPVVVVELGDAQARLLAQALNRTRGSDDPVAYAALLERVLEEFSPAQAVELLPESEATIDRVLYEYGSKKSELVPDLVVPTVPRSRLGEIYQLGEHRLLCGDATDREAVAELFAGEQAVVLATDPPYGVGVDHSWRDGVRQPAGSARTATLLNDDRSDWAEAYQLGGAVVAYVWHSALRAGECFAGLDAAGFVVRQQIIWAKEIHALSRADYQWGHEPAWYAVRAGENPRWQGGRKQTTVWTAPSPIAGFGTGGKNEDTVTRHPTQKPLTLFERPVLNHTVEGEIVYDPFCGSGTALIAAAKHRRRCFAVELDPAWCDVIRDRYEAWEASR